MGRAAGRQAGVGAPHGGAPAPHWLPLPLWRLLPSCSGVHAHSSRAALAAAAAAGRGLQSGAHLMHAVALHAPRLAALPLGLVERAHAHIHAAGGRDGAVGMLGTGGCCPTLPAMSTAASGAAARGDAAARQVSPRCQPCQLASLARA